MIAQRNPELYEPVLIPFHGGLPSATGSWHVDLWIRNDSEASVDVFPTGGHLLAPCRTCEITIDPFPSLPPKSTLYHRSDIANAPVRPYQMLQSNSTPGAFLYVEREKLRALSITASLIFGSDAGPATALPVVPVTQFRVGTSSAQGILVDPSRRYAVRVFGAPEVPAGALMHVKVYQVPQTSTASGRVETLLGSQTLAFRGDYDPTLGLCLLGDCALPDVPFKPVYIQLFTLPGSLGETEGSWIRVEFDPVDPALRYYPIVSATDDQQTVAIYTP